MPIASSFLVRGRRSTNRRSKGSSLLLANPEKMMGMFAGTRLIAGARADFALGDAIDIATYYLTWFEWRPDGVSHVEEERF